VLITWQIIHIAAIQQEVPIFRIAQRRHITTERHGGAYVTPQRSWYYISTTDTCQQW